MPLVDPKFDTRTYREILNEVLARIPAALARHLAGRGFSERAVYAALEEMPRSRDGQYE